MRLNLNDVAYLGRDLRRPECVLVQKDGVIWASDESAAVTRISPDGTQVRLGAPGGVANGLAMAPDGALIVADIALGRIRRLAPDGSETILLDRLDGEALGAVNFVYLDQDGVLWVTVSTRMQPRSRAIESPIPDGYILRIKDGQVRRVATGLCFPNEVRIDRAGDWMFVAESGLGRIIRMRINADGDLDPPELFGPGRLFEGAIVDGIAFDAEGALWVTEVTRNGLHRITPDGAASCLLEDPSAQVLNFPSSVAFGGPDLKTLYIGSLRMDRLARLPSPVAGAPLSHWGSMPA